MVFGRRIWAIVVAVASVAFQSFQAAGQQRVLGIDVSAHQADITSGNWATLKRATNLAVGGVFGDGRDFVFIRSSRGGTTGEDHRQGGYPVGDRTFFNLSQRYDDPYFEQNMNRSTAAGFLAGPYHFSRPDVIASTLNSDGVTTAGVPNTGMDEADHFMQMAGTWMRPGYLLPVLDLEAGQAQRTAAEMIQFAIEFADRIYDVKGIRPMIYINGNYASYLQPGGASVVNALPHLWSARWPNQTDPDSIPVQTGHPKDTYTPIYGPWDDPPNPTHPWKFWQYASTARLNGYASGTRNIDVDVAQGGIEFVKDHLVPAMWVNSGSGQWTTLSNWNSGQAPVAAVRGPGQLSPIGTQTLPAARLPGSNDTVVIERAETNITVTLASGSHNIRKLYVREPLNISGGTLVVNYAPSSDSTPTSAEFEAPVTLSGNASLSVHTLQVAATELFTISGGALGFNRVQLTPHSSLPAKILVNGGVTLSALGGVTASIVRGGGTGSSGVVDLNGAARTLSITDTPAEVDVSIDVALANGGLTKAGAGTLRLNSANAYAGGTMLFAGRLLVNNAVGSGTGNGAVTVNGGILGGTGTVAGVVTVGSGGTVMPGTASSMGRLTLNSGASFNGTNLTRIDRNGGAPLSDRIVAPGDTLAFGGTLIVSNVGAALVGGEVFTNFEASAYSGAFANIIVPPLSGGLNWYVGGLVVDGTIRVNRRPVASQALFTYDAPQVLQIPITSLTTNATDADGDPITLSGVSLTTSNGITVTTNQAFIFYSNVVSVADHFQYTVSDGRGGSATGMVQIAASPRARFTAYPAINSSSVTLRFSGEPGATYHVERSTNLPVWVTVSTNIAPVDGVVDYADSFQGLNPPPPTVFYRLRGPR